MKRPYIKLLGLIIVLLFAGLIFTSLKSSKKYRFNKAAEVQHSELIKANHFISPEEAKALLSNQDDDYVIVDIRRPRDFDNFHIPGSVNIPLQRVLDDKFKPYLNNNKKKILYSAENIKANEIWLLLSQFGYDNLFVLQGGANYWKDHMISKNVFDKKGEFDDEKLNFDPKKLNTSK